MLDDVLRLRIEMLGKCQKIYKRHVGKSVRQKASMLFLHSVSYMFSYFTSFFVMDDALCFGKVVLEKKCFLFLKKKG